MTNMEKIAEMLGVKIGEEFNIESYNYNPCKITESELIDCEGDYAGDILLDLLMGRAKIQKIEPKQEQKITVVTQVCGYCSKGTSLGFTQIIKDCEIHTICDECLEKEYGIKL